MARGKNRSQVEDQAQDVEDGPSDPQAQPPVDNDHVEEGAEQFDESGDKEPEPDGEPSEPTPVAPPLSAHERLALLEAKVESIGHGLHALVTHSNGHLLDDFIDEWKKLTGGLNVSG